MFQSLNLLNYLTAVQNITSAMEITGVAPATASAGPKNSWTASASKNTTATARPCCSSHPERLRDESRDQGHPDAKGGPDEYRGRAP